MRQSRPELHVYAHLEETGPGGIAAPLLPQFRAQILHPGIVDERDHGPAPANSFNAAATFAPEEKPAKMPSSRASRRGGRHGLVIEPTDVPVHLLAPHQRQVGHGIAAALNAMSLTGAGQLRHPRIHKNIGSPDCIP